MKRIKIKRQNNAAVNFSAFGGIDTRVDGKAGEYKHAEYSSGFDMSDGTLKECAGLSEYSQNDLPEKGVALWFYKRNDPLVGVDDRIVVMGTSGKLYECPAAGGAFSEIQGVTLTQKPIGVAYNYNGDDVMIFASALDGLYVYDGTNVTQAAGAPPITSACIHYERLFATVEGGKTLWFSDDFDPTNWSVSLSEAGFIDLTDFRGEMLRALSFLDYLYVFRKYGISRVSAYGDQTEFAVSDLFTSSGKINGDSITFCGDRILFAASDGFYSFNGLSAAKILGGLDRTIDFSLPVKGKYFDGKAYFSVSVKKDGTTVPCLLVYRPSSGDYYLIEGLNIVDFQLIDGHSVYKLLFLDGDGDRLLKLDASGAARGKAITKEWRGKPSDFGIRRKKTMTELSLCTSADITVTVSDGAKTHSFALAGGGERKTVRPNMRGYNFSVKIICEEAKAEISALTVKFGYYL